MTAGRDPFLGMIWMFAGVTLMSFMHVSIRWVSDGLHPFEIAFFRNLLALVPVLPWLIHNPREVLKTDRPGTVILRGVVNTFCMLGYFYAISVAPLAEVTALSFTAPIFATMLAIPLFGDRVGIRRWLAIAAGFLGVLIILRPGFQQLGLGQVIIVSVSFGWGLCLLMIRDLGRTHSALTIATYMSLVMTPLSLFPALFVWQWPNLEQFAWLLLIACLGFCGQYGMTQALRLTENHVLTPIEFSRLIIMALLAYWFFDEIPDRFVWMGSGLIFLACGYIAYREHVIRRTGKIA